MNEEICHVRGRPEVVSGFMKGTLDVRLCEECHGFLIGEIAQTGNVPLTCEGVREFIRRSRRRHLLSSAVKSVTHSGGN